MGAYDADTIKGLTLALHNRLADGGGALYDNGMDGLTGLMEYLDLGEPTFA